MNSELNETGVKKLKALRDQALETHKMAGDSSARVESKNEVQPREEWNFRKALRENSDSLIDLAEMGLQAQELALSLRALMNASVKNAGSEYTGAMGNASLVLRAYEYKRQARMKKPWREQVAESVGEEVEAL